MTMPEPEKLKKYDDIKKSLESSYSWLSPRWISSLSWNTFSEGMLRTVEKKILQVCKTPYRGAYVDLGGLVGPADKIWTISMNTESPKTPLVLLHDMGAGAATWCLNLDSFAEKRPVYAIDLLGSGRSSRPDFSTNALEAEFQLVKSIEEWRKEMNLVEFIILGHGFGGFLAASYSIYYPNKVKHLILADPWGFPEKPPEVEDDPLWIKTISYCLRPMMPLAPIRVAGRFAPWLIKILRSDIWSKYTDAVKDPDLMPQYIYQCNSQKPSGERAFHSMMSGYGWAKNPIVNRIDMLQSAIPVTLLCGSRSWVDNSAGKIIQDKRKTMNSYFKLQVVSGAGHHIFYEKPEQFNQMVHVACDYSDSHTKYPKYLAIMSANKPEHKYITSADEPEHEDVMSADEPEHE